MNKALVLGSLLLFALATLASASVDPESVAGKCLTCHKEKSPGLYKQWYASEHARHGVTCMDCHQADGKDADAYEHEGGTIATLVTPKDCGRCRWYLLEDYYPAAVSIEGMGRRKRRTSMLCPYKGR
jgi:uncharacterized membrane protein